VENPERARRGLKDITPAQEAVRGNHDHTNPAETAQPFAAIAQKEPDGQNNRQDSNDDSGRAVDWFGEESGGGGAGRPHQCIGDGSPANNQK